MEPGAEKSVRIQEVTHPQMSNGMRVSNLFELPVRCHPVVDVQRQRQRVRKCAVEIPEHELIFHEATRSTDNQSMATRRRLYGRLSR